MRQWTAPQAHLLMRFESRWIGLVAPPWPRLLLPHSAGCTNTCFWASLPLRHNVLHRVDALERRVSRNPGSEFQSLNSEAWQIGLFTPGDKSFLILDCAVAAIANNGKRGN